MAFSATKFPWQEMTQEESAQVAAILSQVEDRRLLLTRPDNSEASSEALEAAGRPASNASLSDRRQKYYEGQKTSTLAQASLTFKDVGYTVKLADGQSKTILEPCSGHLEAGHLVAIMGPSGSGKTTLLDCLAMKKSTPHTGEIRVNGHTRHPRLFRRVAAYVGQDDSMPAHWRVREAVRFSAQLKLPKGTLARRKVANDMVETILDEFGLTEVADVYLGGPEVRGISGGQRRRVSLARGVVARAPLLFCDEPTSGLSATDAELCVRALQAATRKFGVLCLVVIHQPRAEVVDLFDTLLLLTSHPGRVTYMGPMAEAASYFASCGYDVTSHPNPADAFLDLVTPGAAEDASEALVAAFAARQAPGIRRLVEDAYAHPGPNVAEMVCAMQGFAVSEWRLPARAAPYRVQLAAVLQRKVRITARNPAVGLLNVAIPCVMGTVVGSIYQGIGHQTFLQQVPFIFALITAACFQSMGIMPELIEQRHYMKYETSEGLYHESVSAIASFLVDVPLALLGCTNQTLITYWFSGLPQEHLGIIFMWTVLAFFFYDSLFACIAALAKDAQTAQLVSTPFLMVFLLFNGFVVSKEGSPVWLRWIFEISPNFYSMQGVVTVMAKDSPEQGQMMVDAFGYKEETKKGLVVMVTCIVTLRVVQVLALKFLNNIKR